MSTVALLVLVIGGAWAASAVFFAFLTGGMISARDHRDAPYGGYTGPRPVVQLVVGRARS